jgi:hypothetical protein
MLVANAYVGRADIEAAKKVFEVAAKEAKVWVVYRGLFPRSSSVAVGS